MRRYGSNLYPPSLPPPSPPPSLPPLPSPPVCRPHPSLQAQVQRLREEKGGLEATIAGLREEEALCQTRLQNAQGLYLPRLLPATSSTLQNGIPTSGLRRQEGDGDRRVNTEIIAGENGVKLQDGSDDSLTSGSALQLYELTTPPHQTTPPSQTPPPPCRKVCCLGKPYSCYLSVQGANRQLDSCSCVCVCLSADFRLQRAASLERCAIKAAGSEPLITPHPPLPHPSTPSPLHSLTPPLSLSSPLTPPLPHPPLPHPSTPSPSTPSPLHSLTPPLPHPPLPHPSTPSPPHSLTPPLPHPSTEPLITPPLPHPPLPHPPLPHPSTPSPPPPPPPPRRRQPWQPWR